MNSDFVSRNPNERPQELLIIRRRSGGRHEHPHGGIWKIAYADFMTAMMAFFLVMWLLNATDKQTISAVASYFNPVKLTDQVRRPKGLHDLEPDAHGAESAEEEARSIEEKPKPDVKSESGRRPTFQEEVLFSNPYGVLAQLAERAKREISETKVDADGSAGMAIRDPFDPRFRFLVARANAGELKTSSQIEDGSAEMLSAPLENAPDLLPGTGAALQSQREKSKSGEGEPKGSGSPASVAEPKPASFPTVEGKIADEIRSSLNDSVPGRKPNVEVASRPDGILISLTDEFDFGMFAIASAEPSPELVVIMEQLAKVLKDHPGPLVVRGHTDGRPFRTKTYDNWRLSSARAHMAYFMLVRGGLDENRFERIEGHADRSLKVASDPEAAQNRRIEILLRKPEAS